MLARSGTVPTKAMRCNARLAFVLSGVSARNQRLHADLNPKGQSPSGQHGPASKSPTRLKGGPCSNSEKTQWLNPANRKSGRERIGFGSKRVGPKVEKTSFGTWLNKSCATRTRVRRHAPLTRCNAVERPTAIPTHCRTITSSRISANRSSQMARENDLEGQQDMGGKHGGQAGMPKPEDRSSAQQGIVRDERGQEQPADKARAQHVSRKDRGDDPPGDPKQR